jgi:hypothetical protein
MCGVLLSFPPLARAQDDGPALARKARALLETHCYRCHDQDGTNEGGVNYILDRDKLIERRKLIPGEPDKSRLYKRVTHPNDPMPPEEEKVRPSKDEMRLLRAWIAAGAPGATTPTSKRALVSAAEMLALMRADLTKVGERSRRFTRYFTLAHLYKAGLSTDELQSYRHALSKLVNSLSWDGKIVVPQPIDPAGTILRIDLRDYQWNEKTWEAILTTNPYGVAADLDVARDVYQATECKQPQVRGDWFVAAASRSPLYHEVLRLPATLRELEKLLRFDSAENIRQETVARAGFNSSGVSRNNRLIDGTPRAASSTGSATTSRRTSAGRTCSPTRSGPETARRPSGTTGARSFSHFLTA